MGVSQIGIGRPRKKMAPTLKERYAQVVSHVAIGTPPEVPNLVWGRLHVGLWLFLLRVPYVCAVVLENQRRTTVLEGSPTNRQVAHRLWERP